MTQQSDLFKLGPGASISNVFPEFEIRHPESAVHPQPNHMVMRVMLQKLGFSVGELRHHVGPIHPHFPSRVTEEETHIFEVGYPKGWRTSENLTHIHYLGDHDPIHHLLDPNGYLRGLIFCDSNGVPLRARLFTRYTIFTRSTQRYDFGGLDWDHAKTVVIDRTKICHDEPFLIRGGIIHVDTRDLLEERCPGLDRGGLSLREQMALSFKYIQPGESGSSLWLDKHFPEWRDPVAYWPI